MKAIASIIGISALIAAGSASAAPARSGLADALFSGPSTSQFDRHFSRGFFASFLRRVFRGWHFGHDHGNGHSPGHGGGHCRGHHDDWCGPASP